MAKVKTNKIKTQSEVNKRNLIIVGTVVLLIAGVAFFAEKQKAKEASLVQPPKTAGIEVLHLRPDQGCKLDDSGLNYECNLLVRNTSDAQLDWFGEIEGLEGATLTNNGEGTVEPNNNAVITLKVPVSYCEAMPEGHGTVSIKDSSKSTNQSLASFYCNEVPEGEEK